MASLSIQEIKRLRQIGHSLNPVVMIGGQGLTENVIEETLRALNDHELIKVKVVGEDREIRSQVIEALAEQTQSHAVQKIGKIVLLYKKAAQQNQKLSNLVRYAHLSN
ncbi:ribosome assembly RNA-binding protein YhbY [Acinetobacter rathckeae]|uniref:ribosome assembly RNA-binding protein YhbY n=1 Tax=Acinetobacter rathckeae TaxID=2605272 RepID=UPI0018A24F71|nr:ribosome assembly RNA-binding protein YhbY [Acinetobacter rathckeae]MBF7686735.1 ribosome assembly RNA-binding protein YhbY [Acinetobacter rathckeae]MBF7695733.1 ribosome assembly RNA-binding protein YhbY [Acinetobacter rathckeae]